MSLDTPTTKQVSDNIVSQLGTTLNQTIPLLPKAFLRVLSRTLAGVFILLYKYAGFLNQQLFVASASSKDTEINGLTINPLTEWGVLIGVGPPAPASQAEMTITITVLNQTGSLPSYSQLVGPSNGVTYTTLEAVALDAATITATIRAVSDQSGGGGLGAVGNLEVGDKLSFASPIANVSSTVEVATIVTTGADAEDVEVYRQRIIDYFQRRPQGGALTDYRNWGEEPAGILNVYPYRSACPGQVSVYVEAADQTDGIPTGAQLVEVADAIEQDESGLASRRPLGALVEVLPINRLAFDVEVVGLSVDDEVTVKSQIESALTDYFLAREPFLLGLSLLPRTDRVSQAAVGGVIEDIVSAAGGVFSAAYVSRSTVGVTLYALAVGEKAKLGTTTYS